MNDFYATLKIQHGPLRHAIQAAGFSTPIELAKTMGMNPTLIYGLLNFKQKPLNPKNGKWRDSVLKVCSFLGFSPEELFPEHLQRVVATNRFETFASASSLPSAEPPPAQLPPYEAIDQAEIRKLIDGAISTLSENHQAVLKARFFEGKTLDELSAKWKITRQSVANRERSALLALNRPAVLREYLKEAHLLIESVPA